MVEGTPDTDDLYAVLGVESSATADEIRTAYRALAHRFHPDHNLHDMAAVRRMQQINNAFAILVATESRGNYDRLRRLGRPADVPDGRHGAGRSPRPYYRGQNWGLHAGAETPPEFIVRVQPAGFNLAVSADGYCQPREVRVSSDAPFPVTVRTICSPWLTASDEFFSLDASGDTRILVGVAEQARRELRGWRDGGVSLATDDTRVFCPDIRITAVFMGAGPTVAPAETAAKDACSEPSLPPIAGGWLRRVLRL